jgi:hypothetical protein
MKAEIRGRKPLGGLLVFGSLLLPACGSDATQEDVADVPQYRRYLELADPEVRLQLAVSPAREIDLCAADDPVQRLDELVQGLPHAHLVPLAQVNEYLEPRFERWGENGYPWVKR